MKTEDGKVGMRVCYEPGNNGPISRGTIKKVCPSKELDGGFFSVAWDDSKTHLILALHVEQEERYE